MFLSVLCISFGFENTCAPLLRPIFGCLTFPITSVTYIMAVKFVSKSTFAPEKVAAAHQLEPALESLRSLKVHESDVTAMRVNEFLDGSVFSDLAQDDAKMRKSAAAFVIDLSEEAEFPPSTRDGETSGRAKTQNEVKITVDAAAKAHGETSLRRQSGS